MLVVVGVIHNIVDMVSLCGFFSIGQIFCNFLQFFRRVLRIHFQNVFAEGAIAPSTRMMDVVSYC